MTDRNQDKKDDFIFGLRPVIEAIEAGKTIDKIFIQNGLQGDIIAELKKLLSKHGIRANYVPVEKLNRFTRKNHQGVVAFISDVAFYKVEDVVPQLFDCGRKTFFCGDRERRLCRFLFFEFGAALMQKLRRDAQTAVDAARRRQIASALFSRRYRYGGGRYFEQG